MPVGEFWVTHEYRPAGALDRGRGAPRPGPDLPARVRRRAPRLPDAVVAEVAALPAVEAAHQLEVAETPLPGGHASLRSAVAPAGPDRSPVRPRPDSRTARRPGRGARHRRQPDHPELRGKIVARADFVDLDGLDTTSFVGDVLGADDDPEDELGHGTHVAGIIAAEGRQMPGSRQTAGSWRCACWPPCARRPGAGRRHRRQHQPGDQVGRRPRCRRHQHEPGHPPHRGGLPHKDVISYALNHGVTVVAASGNDGTETKYYPGALPGVFAVGAVDDVGGGGVHLLRRTDHCRRPGRQRPQRLRTRPLRRRLGHLAGVAVRRGRCRPSSPSPATTAPTSTCRGGQAAPRDLRPRGRATPQPTRRIRPDQPHRRLQVAAQLAQLATQEISHVTNTTLTPTASSAPPRPALEGARRFRLHRSDAAMLGFTATVDEGGGANWSDTRDLGGQARRDRQTLESEARRAGSTSR